MVDSREYYAEQSGITNPREFASLLDRLPGDTEGLSSAVRGLLIHHLRGSAALGSTIPQARLRELDTCYVSRMLDRIVELDDRPLKESRPPERRLVACCRDFAVLFCGMARHKGIPARVRFGFWTRPCDEFSYLHVVSECWDAMEKRWIVIDPELGDQDVLGEESVTDFGDRVAGAFVTGTSAWRAFREGKTDGLRFGRAPGSEPSGACALARSAMRDLAALSGMELMLWSGAAQGDRGAGEVDGALLDRASKLSALGDDEFRELQEICQALPRLESPPRPAIGLHSAGLRRLGESVGKRSLQSGGEGR